ncbi:hypothetical protein BDR07DRAFT_1305500 [Suillus spraguei]|nr:hypothetical protein BDR07DRAFT_1305500 [Suillus spraguei]
MNRGTYDCNNQHLLLHTHLYKFKDVNIRGQQANTHAVTVIKKVKHNVTGASERYCHTRTALSSLCRTLGEDGWQSILCVNRWTEEVQLLLEEMQRVREFLSWHAIWWDEQAG